MYNEKSQLDYLPIIFVTLEIFFVITIIVILSNLLGTNNITTDINSYPAASIENLHSSIPELSSKMADTIKRQLYTALLDNSSKNYILNSVTNANIVEGSIKRNYFDTRGGVTLISAAIDVPESKQSYSFFYGYPDQGNNDFQTFYTILCPVSDNVGSYADFDCNNSFEGNDSKKDILASFLAYFDFEYFSAYLDPNNPSRIIIGSLINYNISEETKNSYIKNVRTAVDSLGMDPNEFEYYVRTAADIDYENKDR